VKKFIFTENGKGQWFWRRKLWGLITIDKGGPFSSQTDCERDAWRNGWCDYEPFQYFI
jgi:hypothetical protein